MCHFNICIPTPPATQRSTAHASLAALGCKLRYLDLFGPIRHLVQIPQKTVRHSPTDKLLDAFITILAGAQGLHEINTRLRADPALQAAFGRTACAEQSVVQETLDAATPENVLQLQAALAAIFQTHSAAVRHDFAHALLILDADMSGRPCGPKAAFATKGYFAGKRNRRGRQLGRVLATAYDEIVYDETFPGTVQLAAALPGLIQAAAVVLGLDVAQRQRTLVRVDGGGGSQADLNWLLAAGYQILAKEYSTARARKLAATVTDWIADPTHPGREIGYVTAAPTEYVRPVLRIAVRCAKANGQWGVGVLVTSLTGGEVIAARGGDPATATDPAAVLRAYVYLYDARGGGVETSFKGDTQGLGARQRNKKRFAAQQMVGGLTTLAHNVLIWARRWLAPIAPGVAEYGLKRLVRDVLAITGVIIWTAPGQIQQIILNQDSHLAHRVLTAFQHLLRPAHVAVSLGET
jgi:hypothetical protein